MVWPLIGALAGGALSFLGGMQQNASNEKIAGETTAFNAEQAGLNRDFQERMSNTAYQRARFDMEQAGFNPMLAYSQGGASSPGGSSASGVSYTAQNVGESAVRGAQAGTASAIAARMMKENIENIQADTAAKGANEKAAQAAAVASIANANNANANSATTNAIRPFVVGINAAQEARTRAEAVSADNAAAISNIEKQYVNTHAGRLARTLALTGTDASKVTSSIKQAIMPSWLR